MATSTVEDYLKQIYQAQLTAPGSLVPTGQVASALEVAPGTATAMVKTLAEAGLVEYEPYSGVCLTPAGEKLASHVLRRHRLVELFLVEVMGMDWSEVHSEAELLEHAVSERLLRRIDTMLGGPQVDPHGDPIPTAGGEVATADYANLVTCPVEATLMLVQVTDQTSDFLRLMESYGLLPGVPVEVVARDEQADTVEVRPLGGNRVSLGFRAASKIRVAPPTDS
ncbi:MAG: metal-dependent transcriptional regulator [Acidobacteriota bacterium]|nr:metal-dependent transcriptional regulator [Acidobacteriota bacterium]MEC8944158.1 metal-dependent transcriptional regulator [Acidobacteriota bacterium]